MMDQYKDKKAINIQMKLKKYNCTECLKQQNIWNYDDEYL